MVREPLRVYQMLQELRDSVPGTPEAERALSALEDVVVDDYYNASEAQHG